MTALADARSGTSALTLCGKYIAMSLSEFGEKKCEIVMENFLKRKRPPEHIRHQLDIGYRIDNQSIEIFEVRPVWNNPKEKREGSVGKVTYNKSKRMWKIFWQRADLKWHSYEPCSEVRNLEEALKIIEEDNYGCFWG